MKATGIVRRIEACVIITQKLINAAETLEFLLVCPTRRIGVKNGFSAIFIHNKSEVKFTSLLWLVIV